MPGSNGLLGKLVAYDLGGMSELWNHQQPAMFMTGKLLWQTRLAAGLHGFPISYSAIGKQYVAVPTGLGVFRALTAVLSPEIYQPEGGNALYVFELVNHRE
jgi:alcohol dehydrogenase (cytochrome c)